jgi:TonB family protein
MSDTGEKPVETPVVTKLYQAQAKTEAGQYRDALSVVRESKVLEPRNIYILAFEKQVEQLAELSEMNMLSDEQRADILESLPGIIERAAESSNAPQDTAPARDTRAELNREREERAAALEWLKNQYFQHAHEYVRKEEYQHALAEIRRVFIIDPNNKIAKDFEKQIDQLISLRKVQATPRTQTAASAYPGGGGSPRTDSSGLRTTPETTEPKAKSPISSTVIIAVVLTLIAIAIAFYYFRAREKMLKPPAPTQQDVGALSINQPSEVAEQGFVISQTEGRGTVSSQVTPESTPAPAGVSASGDYAPRDLKEPEPSSRNERSAPSSRREEQSPAASTSGESPPPVSPPPAQGGTNGPGITENGSETLLEEARIVRLARPQLPRGVYATGLEGQVVVQVEIDKDGQPRHVKIVRSTNDLLDRAVIEAINNSEFAPRKMSSGPATSRITIPFSFRARR